MTITEFLLTRIAEDEAVAREVEGEARRQFKRSPADYGGEDPTKETGVWQADGNIGDPVFVMGVARVLAECEAKRRIVEFHRNWPVLVERPVQFEPSMGAELSFADQVTFRATQQIQWVTEQEYRAKFGDEPPTGPMLCALASVYADHPDFDPAWRVAD